MPNSDPEGRIFLSATNNHDRFFLLHTFWPPTFDFYLGVTINESCSYTLTSAILTVNVIYDVTMTSTSNVLTTELHDLYNQCIDNTCWYSIFIYPTGRIRVCKIRFVSTGKNHGKPCLVCKKRTSTVTTIWKRDKLLYPEMRAFIFLSRSHLEYFPKRNKNISIWTSSLSLNYYLSAAEDNNVRHFGGKTCLAF